MTKLHARLNHYGHHYRAVLLSGLSLRQGEIGGGRSRAAADIAKRRGGASDFGAGAELAMPIRATDPLDVVAIGRLTTAGVAHSVIRNARDRRRRRRRRPRNVSDREEKWRPNRSSHIAARSTPGTATMSAT